MKDKSPRAAFFIEHYLTNPGDNAWNIPEMLQQMQAVDKKRAVEWARKFLNHEDARLRLESALMVPDSGDKQASIPVIAATLPVGKEMQFGGLAVKAVDELVALGSPESINAAASVLLNPAIRPPNAFEDFSQHMRANIVMRLAAAGHPEGYKLYLDLLDVKGTQFGRAWYGDPPAKQAVAEILDVVGKADPELQKARQIKDFEARRLTVRRWVEGKLNPVKSN